MFFTLLFEQTEEEPETHHILYDTTSLLLFSSNNDQLLIKNKVFLPQHFTPIERDTVKFSVNNVTHELQSCDIL